MIIPFRELSPDALRGVLEEYVTRDGTEMGEAAAKIESVRGALERGELLLVYDSDAESCNLLSPEDAAIAEESRQASAETQSER